MKCSLNRFLVMLMSDVELLQEQQEQLAMISQLQNDYYNHS